MVCYVTTCLTVNELRRQCTSYMAPTKLWDKFLLLNWDGFKWIPKKNSLMCIKTRHTHPQFYETDCTQWKFGTSSYYRSTFQGTKNTTLWKNEPLWTAFGFWVKMSSNLPCKSKWLDAEFSINSWKQNFKIPLRWVFFILNLTECYQLMKYKQRTAKGTIDAENLLSELCHCGCLLCKTLHQRNFVVPKWVDSCSSSASFPFP